MTSSTRARLLASVLGVSIIVATAAADAAVTATRIELVPSGKAHPRGFVALGSRIYFGAFEATGGLALYGSDGTIAGTGPIKTLVEPAAVPMVRTPKVIASIAHGGAVLLAVDNGTAETLELWRSDGTSAGTVRLSGTLGPAPAGVSEGMGGFYVLGSQIVFRLRGEVFAIDGTGAKLITGSNAATRSGNVQLGSTLYVSGDEGIILKTNGVTMSEAFAGFGGSLFGACGSTLFLRKLAGIYATNGSSAPVQVRGSGNFGFPACAGAKIVFPVQNGNTQSFLPWASDGTVASTFALSTTDTGGVPQMVSVGKSSAERVLFVMSNLPRAAALEGYFTTDGTAAHTQRVRYSGPEPVVVKLGTVAGRTFYHDQQEVFDTDGITVNGPAPATVIPPFRLAGQAVLGNKIFGATSEEQGLWVLDTGLTPQADVDGGSSDASPDPSPSAPDAAGGSAVPVGSGDAPKTNEASGGGCGMTSGAAAGTSAWGLLILAVAIRWTRRRQSRLASRD